MNTEKFYHDSAIKAYEKYLEKISVRTELEYPGCLELMRDAVDAVTFFGLGLVTTVNNVFKQHLENIMTPKEQYFITKMAASYSLISKINYLKILPAHKMDRVKELYEIFCVLTHSANDLRRSKKFESWFSFYYMPRYHETYMETLALLKEKYPQYMPDENYIDVGNYDYSYPLIKLITQNKIN